MVGEVAAMDFSVTVAVLADKKGCYNTRKFMTTIELRRFGNIYRLRNFRKFIQEKKLK